MTDTFMPVSLKTSIARKASHYLTRYEATTPIHLLEKDHLLVSVAAFAAWLMMQDVRWCSMKHSLLIDLLCIAVSGATSKP